MGFNLKQLFSLLTSPGWRTEEYTDSELEEMMNAGDQEAAQQETQNTAAQAETPGGAGIDWESYQNNGLNDSAPTVRQTEDSGWVADPGLGLNDYEKLKESFASQAYAELVQKQKGAGQAASGNQPTLGERINYGLKSIGQSWGAAAPMLADTYKQGSQDAKAFQDELIAKGANRWDVWEAYENKDKEWIEQEAARFGVKLNQTVLTPETSKGMQKQAQAAQNSAKALEGSSGFPRDAGEALLSVGQNAVVYPTAFINPAIPVALMGARAAAQREYELASQGVGAGDTQRRGIVSGLIETGTEAISLGSWVKILKAAPLDSITKVIAKQSGTEMTEEGLSYFLNLLSDMAEKDPNAKFSWNDLWHQVKIAGLSGGVMGGTGIEINRAANFLLKGGANTQFNSPESVAKAQGTAFDDTSPDTAASDARQISEQPLDGQQSVFTDADAYKRKLEKDAAKSVAENGDLEYTGNQQETGDVIDGIRITDGKVGGKIPANEFKEIRLSSIKNPESSTLTLGKFTPTVENGIEDWSKPGPDSYIAKAGKSSYFDLGSDYKVIQKKYGLKDSEMFDYLNKPALDEAISKSKTIRFSHNPLDYEKGAIVDEWEYIKSALVKADSDLIKMGDYWYVR